MVLFLLKNQEKTREMQQLIAAYTCRSFSSQYHWHYDTVAMVSNNTDSIGGVEYRIM
jgi:hypothetical protein